MNLNQIINMIVRMVMRRGINAGISRGIDMAGRATRRSQGDAANDGGTDETPHSDR